MIVDIFFYIVYIYFIILDLLNVDTSGNSACQHRKVKGGTASLSVLHLLFLLSLSYLPLTLVSSIINFSVEEGKAQSKQSSGLVFVGAQLCI